MKYLLYNPYEPVSKIHIRSKCFGIDLEYGGHEAGEKPVFVDKLFELAKLDCFDDVRVYFSEHNEAFYKNKKTDLYRTSITGWVSLKEYKNGGGYLDDFSVLK